MWQTKPTPWKLDKRGYDPDDRADELRRRFGRVSRKGIRGRRGRNLGPWIAGGALICVAAVVVHQVARANDWTYGQIIRHILAAPNCNAARVVGLAPAMRNRPGYYLKHDRDRDGVACEPYPRDNAATPRFIERMKSGDSGLVRKWQRHLRDEGIYDGAIDGVYGSQMEQAMTLCALRPACLDFD